MYKLPPSIIEWLAQNGPTLETIRNLLAEKLSDNPVLLTQQLTIIEAWQGRISTLQAEADSMLDLAELRELTNLDSNLKALDRQVRMTAQVATERRVRDICLGLSKAIGNRVILGMALLKSFQGEKWSPV